MESSDQSLTPGTRKNNDSTLTPTPDVKRSSWFTPCKRLGLKRKSQSISTPSSASLQSSTPSTPNSSFKSHRQSFETPVRKNESSGVRTVKGQGLGLNTTKGCLAQDDISPAFRDCVTKTKDETFKTSLLSPGNEETPIRPRPTPLETEIINFEEPTEESVDILRKRVKEKEERVKALQLAQLNKKRHATGKLTELTKKWRIGCQDALLQLHTKTKSLEYKLTMSELLAKLGIPLDLVQYDPDLEDFKE